MKIVKYENTIYETLLGDAKPADIVKEQTADASEEKHVPFVEEKENGYLVKVGKDADHPMTKEHWIQFVEITVDNKHVYRTMLNPGDSPHVMFEVPKGKNVVAREYCNIHGLWKG